MCISVSISNVAGNGKQIIMKPKQSNDVGVHNESFVRHKSLLLKDEIDYESK